MYNTNYVEYIDIIIYCIVIILFLNIYICVLLCFEKITKKR